MLLVWMLHFISGNSLRVGLSLDLYFGGGGSVFLKWSFVGGWFYFEFSGDYFLLRGFFKLRGFLFLFFGRSLLIFIHTIHSHNFFSVFGGSVFLWCAFLFWETKVE